jgi:1-deoxy-D-xylulose 5-phosphate reductoisomerase
MAEVSRRAYIEQTLLEQIRAKTGHVDAMTRLGVSALVNDEAAKHPEWDMGEVRSWEEWSKDLR